MSPASKSRGRGGRWLRRILVYLLLLAVAAGGWLAYELLAPYQAYSKEGVFVDVPRGASLRQIARLLEQNGVVRNAAAFEAYARWQSRTRPAGLQAGEYFFSQPMTSLEVHRMLAEGRVFLYTVQVPEGYSMFDIAALLEEKKLTHREDFLDAARDPSAIRDLAPEASSLEGFLFPATYQFPRHMTAGEMAAAMVRRFREAWSSFPAGERNPQEFSVLRVVTLASLVERETGLKDERPLVSSVFYNRIGRRMPLQCDPTVLYALRLAGQSRAALTLKDLRFKSPYNTYLNPGLPPGPIANPGEQALRAALFPAKSEYLYFVSDAQGGHLFGRTLAEHNANVACFRQMSAQVGQVPDESVREKTSDPPAKPPAPRATPHRKRRGGR